MALGALSYINVEARNRSLLVQAFHTFPDDYAIVKSQSLFQLPLNAMLSFRTFASGRPETGRSLHADASRLTEWARPCDFAMSERRPERIRAARFTALRVISIASRGNCDEFLSAAHDIASR